MNTFIQSNKLMILIVNPKFYKIYDYENKINIWTSIIIFFDSRN